MISHEHSQIHAELIKANREALALVVSAISKQLNVEQLRDDVQRQIFAATSIGAPRDVVHIATEVLAVLDAEIALNRLGGKH